MIIHHKNRYGRALSDSKKTNQMPSGSGSSSQSTALNSDLGSIPVENSTGSRPSKYRRKLTRPGVNNNLGLPSPCTRTSACTTPSTATATELPANNTSHSSLKLSLKIPPPDKINTTTTVEDTATVKTNTDSSATAKQTVELPTPMSASPQSSTLNTHNNALKLSGVQSTSATSPDRENTRLDASYSNQVASLLSPPDSTSTIPTSASSSSTPSLSSVQSEHSSYSVTQKSLPNNSEQNGTPLRATKAKSVASHIETRASSNSFRPVGPAHLEHDYARARKELSNAVAIAAYELFGFAIPVRNAEMESKRPGKYQIPQLRDYPLVQRAAQALDKADEELEAALARGETFDNTPIPDQWRRGSDHLRPHEWARDEPETPEPREKRTRTRVEVAPPEEPRTRSENRQKGTAIGLEIPQSLGGSVQPNSPSCTQTFSGMDHPNTNGSEISLPDSSAMSAIASTSSLVDSISMKSSSTQVPISTIGKRKRGRPRKDLLQPLTIQNQVNPAASPTPTPLCIKIRAPIPSSSTVSTTPTSVTVPPPTTSSTGTEPLSAVTATSKRKRGRPRKYPVPITEQQEGLSPVVERKIEERPSKLRKVGSSESGRA